MAGFPHWRQNSFLTDVGWFQSMDWYTSWLCCFSTLLQEALLWVVRFLPRTKNFFVLLIVDLLSDWFTVCSISRAFILYSAIMAWDSNNYYMLFTGRKVLIGKNCAWGHEESYCTFIWYNFVSSTCEQKNFKMNGYFFTFCEFCLLQSTNLAKFRKN